MGAVYRATDSKLKRDVAIKVLPTTSFRIRAESLTSNSTCPGLSISEYCDLRSRGVLCAGVGARADASRLIAPRPIPMDEALRLAKQMIDALEYAHEGNRSPRPEAGEHQNHSRRPLEGAGFRSRESAGERIASSDSQIDYFDDPCQRSRTILGTAATWLRSRRADGR